MTKNFRLWRGWIVLRYEYNKLKTLPTLADAHSYSIFWSLLHWWADLDGMHRHTYLIGISCTFSSKSLLLLLASERETDRWKYAFYTLTLTLSGPYVTMTAAKWAFQEAKSCWTQIQHTEPCFQKLEILLIPSLHDFFSIQFLQQRKHHHCSARSTSMGCLAKNMIEP